MEILSTAYSRDKDINKIFEIFLLAKEEIEYWLNFNYVIRKKDTPEDFSTDIALEYVYRLASDRFYEKDRFLYVIYNLAKSAAWDLYSRNCIDNLDPRFVPTEDYDISIDNILDQTEMIRRSIDGLSTKLKVLFMYTLLYGDIESVYRLRKYFKEESDFYVVAYKVINMKDSIFDKVGFELETHIPKTPIGNAILLSSLLSKTPEAAQLLILLKDTRRFLQYIILNEGRTIKIPTVKEVIKNILEVSTTIKRIEEDKVVIQDVEILKDMIKTTNTDFDITENLSSFVVSTFNETLKNYQDVNDKIIKRIEYCSPGEIGEIYEILQKQVVSQVSLFRTITMIIDGKVTEIMGNLSNRGDDYEINNSEVKEALQ